MIFRQFQSSARLQDFLLKEAGSGALFVVPHLRLAHQLRQRQRQRELEAGRVAWEPLPLATLGGWWADLFRSLWPEESLAPHLLRLRLWQEVLESGPPFPGAAPNLEWAQALDDAYLLLRRHLQAVTGPDPKAAPLPAWRRELTRRFEARLEQQGLITEGHLPAYLLQALEAGRLRLPETVFLAGFPTPAPVEAHWFQAVARHTRMVHLEMSENPEAVRRAVVLPDPGREVEWVAGQIVESASVDGIPLHRLAVTSPNMDYYAPRLQAAFAEVLGPHHSEAGWAYNFSKGPTLTETPLFRAALLPLRFITTGERREDLVSLLLSPYYGQFQAHQGALARWDRRFRERRVEQGWQGFRRVALQQGKSQALPDIVHVLDRGWESLSGSRATGREWVGKLQETWKQWGFPVSLQEEVGSWEAIKALLQEVAGALGHEGLSGGEFLEWLTHGARQVLLPGPGIQQAGIQIMGLLEMRGLDFHRVFCLGMNSGDFPAPPRPLPLLSPEERSRVLGGTYQSQHRFARELYTALSGTAPEIILTRPHAVDQEEHVATPLYPGEWDQEDLAPLSRPHRAWLRSAAVQAALGTTAGAAPPPEEVCPIDLPLPDQLSITQAQTALACGCRFLLERLLGLRELPEIAPGLDPRERGELLHKVLAEFTAEYKEILAHGEWDDRQARELLQAVARRLLSPLLADPYWQAEWDRWLGEEEGSPGLLYAWLRKEAERRGQGWRWLGMEVAFSGLKKPHWPLALKGRIDRMDGHDDGGVILWDYKSGEVPKPKRVFENPREFQLPAYLLAVRQGRVAAPDAVSLKAGYIGLKSTRKDHLKHEDFPKHSHGWEEILAFWEDRLEELMERLTSGDFRPRPDPAPYKKNPGACEHCLFPLICGFLPAETPEDQEDAD